MNEEYLKEIYGYLGGENYADFETFSKDLSSNPEYNKQIFDYLYSGQEGVSYDAFSFDTGLKKKEPSASSAEPSRTQPTQQEQPSTSLAEDLGINEEELVPTRQEAQQLQQPILDTSDRLREGGQAPDLGSAIETDIRVNEDILRSAREGRPAEQESEFQFDEQVSISSDSEKPVQVEAEIEEPKLKPNETTGVARSLAPAKQILPPFAQTSAAINFYDERVERDYVEAITSNKGKIKAIEKDLEAMGQPTQENASAYLELFDEYNKSATEQVLLLKEKLQFDYDKLIQKDFDERRGVRLAMETLPIGARFGFKAVGSLTAKAQKIAASGASWLAASKFLTTYEQDPNEPLLFREQATEMKQNFLAWARDMYESSRKTSKEYGLVNTIEEINDPLALADFAVTAISETMVDIPLALLTFGGSSYIQTYGNMFLEGLQTLSKEQGKPIEEIINTEEVDRAALNTASLIVAGLDRIGAGKVLGGANLPFMKDALKKNALKQSAIKRATGGALVEVGTENIQEAVEAGGEFASLGKDFIEGMARLDVDDYLNITAKTLFGAGAMSTVNAYMDNGKLTNEFLDVLSKATESELTYKALTSTILARQRAGIYTKEQAESRLQDLMSDIEANQSLPRSIKGDARVEAIGLQKEYSEVKEARDQASDAFKSMYNEELNNLEERLTNILRDETSKKDQELLEAEIRQENEQEKLREEEQTRNVVGDEKAVLEELSDDRIQEEVGQESPELRTETQEVDAVQEQSAPPLSDKFSKGSETALVSIEDLYEYRGEDRLGKDALPDSRERIDKLKKSIQERGLDEPLIMFYDDGKASIIEGNHRLEALRELGYKEVPVDLRTNKIPNRLRFDFTPDVANIKRGSVTFQEVGIATKPIESNLIRKSQFNFVSLPNVASRKNVDAYLRGLQKRGIIRIECD